MTDTTTTGLASWLLEQIAEDEQAARDCGGAPWVDQVPGMVHVDPVAIRDAKWQFGRMGYVATVEHDHDRAHIARHDPARVLAECDAKRRIIELHGPVDRYDTDSCRECSDSGWAGCVDGHSRVALPCPTLRLLALPYSGRPGYRPEWRP